MISDCAFDRVSHKSALDEGDVEPLLLHSLTTVNPSWRK